MKTLAVSRRAFLRSDRGSSFQAAHAPSEDQISQRLIRCTTRTLNLVKSRLPDTHAGTTVERANAHDTSRV